MHDDFSRFNDLVGIGGTQRHESGNRPQRDQLLDRLVGRSIFADADGIVGEDPDRRNFHDGRETNRHFHVVAENQKRRAVARIFDSVMPFTIAPMACSRMPKWKLRALYWPASKSPAPSKVSRVFVAG